MSAIQWTVLIVVFLLTSAVSVVTGSTSLITVPTMLQVHIEPRTALATNMFALTFLSIGAAIPLGRNGVVDRRRFPALTLVTLIGSVLGAMLLLVMPTRSLAIVVPAAMIGVAVFFVVYRKAGIEGHVVSPSPKTEIFGYLFTFLLGIYGGFFSGGYVTILTTVFVAIFGMSLREAVATTKLMNVASSGVATAIFMWKGLIDYKLGIVLGLTMFIGASVGARFVVHVADKWLRRIFLTAVWALGLKALLFDVPGIRGCNKPLSVEQ